MAAVTLRKRERDLRPGDVFKTPNGNLYVSLPNGKQAYIGNSDFGRSTMTEFEDPRLDWTAEHEIVAVLPDVWGRRV